MHIRVDPQSEEPLFEQIAFAVKQATVRGDLKPGDRLPSVRELARELAVNPNTIVHAYEQLAREGLLARRQGAGCFVTGGTRGLADEERRRQLEALLERAVTEALHLGFGADDVRRALEDKLRAIQTPRTREARR